MTPQELRAMAEDKSLDIGTAWNALAAAAERLETLEADCASLKQRALTDCPTCNGTGVETGRLVVELKKAASDCAMDRDYKLAELLDDAANVIGAFASRLNPRVDGAADEQAKKEQGT